MNLDVQIAISRGRGNSKRRSWKSCGIEGVCHQGKLAVPISAETGAKKPLLQTRNRGAKDLRNLKIDIAEFRALHNDI